VYVPGGSGPMLNVNISRGKFGKGTQRLIFESNLMSLPVLLSKYGGFPYVHGSPVTVSTIILLGRRVSGLTDKISVLAHTFDAAITNNNIVYINFMV
jgi:hypothetical protein